MAEFTEIMDMRDLVSDGGNKIEVPSTMINYIVDEMIKSNLSFFQGLHNVFKYVNYNAKGKNFRKHTFIDDEFMWTKANRGCKKTPTGNIWLNSEGYMQPCAVEMYIEFCPKEFFDTCFQQLITWTQSGWIDYDEATLRRIIMMAINRLARSAQRGLDSLNLLGGLFDLAGEMNTELATDQYDYKVIERLIDMNSSCEGLLSKITNYYSECIVDCLPKKLSGDCWNQLDICKLFEDLFCKATPELQSAITNGGVPFGNNGQKPLFVVSSNITNSLMGKFKELQATQMQNNSKFLLDMRRETLLGQTRTVYTICGVDVVPLDEFCSWGKYLKGEFVFAALTLSENMQLGSNFVNPNGANGDIGFELERETSIKGGAKGMYYMCSEALIGNDLADKRYFVASMKYYKKGVAVPTLAA